MKSVVDFLLKFSLLILYFGIAVNDCELFDGIIDQWNGNMKH